MSEEHRFTVGSEEEGERLDAAVAARFSTLSRTQAARLVEQGGVHVDGASVRKSARLELGQQVTVQVPDPEPIEAEPEDIPLDIVFEDAHLVVLNKPTGLVVHPAPGHPNGTLVNALLFHVRDLSGIGGALRPGIVHRLDKDTSGLMLVAKGDKAHQALSDALKAREVRRRYIAAAWGHLAEDPVTVDAPLARDPRNRQRMGVVAGGREARTHFRVRERWPGAELIEAALDTGRTHQIRVHLAHLGHPVVGDHIYGAGWEKGIGGPNRQWAAELARRAPRQILHAKELVFDHPITGESMRFESPLPPDLAEVVAWARGDG